MAAAYIENKPVTRNNTYGLSSLVSSTGTHGPHDPNGWSTGRKVFLTALLIIFPLITNLATSILTTANLVLEKEFGAGMEETILTTSMFMIGFAFGPLFIGPLSERVGRKYPLIIGMLLFATFSIPVALAKNIETIIVCRFCSGLFGSCALAVVGGAISDIWQSPVSRGIGVDLFTAAALIGPLLGPICGSYITSSSLGWRWNIWVLTLAALIHCITTYFFLPETYAPVLLRQKARGLRAQDSDLSYEKLIVISELSINAYLLRPWKLMVTEPILVLMTIYMSFITGLIFIFFEGYPASFSKGRGWSPERASLAFLPLIGGAILGVTANILYTLRIDKKRLAANKNGKMTPEQRLPPMIAASLILPAGLFWFAFTSPLATPWQAQVVSGIPVGAAIIVILTQGMKYTVDVYNSCANSALSLNTFARSSVAAGFPLFATVMYQNLGVTITSTVLGCVALGLTPIPLVFYTLGSRVRALSCRP